MANKSSAAPRKIDQSGKKEALESAFQSTVEVLCYVNDHCSTLSSRLVNLFKTPMLQAIEGADLEGTAKKSKRIVKQISLPDITKQLQKIAKASKLQPSRYHEKTTKSSSTRKDKVLVHELENLRSIVCAYQKHLNDEGSRNLFAKTRAKRTKPDNTNSNFSIIERAPGQEKKDK